MTPALASASSHERHIARRIEARGDPGLVEALLGLKGLVVGGRHRIESLYAVGGEGAVYLTRDLRRPAAGASVAKVALHPIHRPFRLEARAIRRQRDGIRLEARYLQGSGSRFLPSHQAFFEFENPLLDRARGGAFGDPEPLLLMEKLPGCDLDRWLARMHRSGVPRADMRRTLDRVTVVLLQALVDLYDRGFFYADLRPANLRVIGRPDRVVRLLDAGSLVTVHDQSGRFPHVPSYLPPNLFRDRLAGRKLTPSAATQAIMAGRTLYEVATGLVPHPGDDVNRALLKDSNVSPPVGEVIDGLCHGDFVHVRHAYRYLARRASRRVHGGNDPTRISQVSPPRRVNGSAAPAAERSIAIDARSVNSEPRPVAASAVGGAAVVGSAEAVSTEAVSTEAVSTEAGSPVVPPPSASPAARTKPQPALPFVAGGFFGWLRRLFGA